MNIPFVDLKRQYKSIEGEVSEKVRGVMESGAFILGSCGSNFEREFASFCGARFAVAVNSGTDALSLSLMALGVGPGDEVVLPANTFIATAEAVSFAGANPVLAEVDPVTCNIDVAKITRILTGRTKAVIPVHLYGQPADMEPLARVCGKLGLKIIEDACQAHGAEYQGRRTGVLGDMAAFSFYPGKNLGAYGDGGAVVTDSPEMAEKIKILRNHGSSRKYYHEVVGFNSRLDEIQAAVLSVKLKRLTEWNERRRQNALVYAECMRDLSDEGLVTLPRESENTRHVYHLYVIRVQEEIRDRMVEHLSKAGVSAQIHYPVPIHLQKAYSHLGYKEGAFPVAEKMAKGILSLPMFPELERSEIEYVADQVRAFLKKASLETQSQAVKV